MVRKARERLCQHEAQGGGAAAAGAGGASRARTSLCPSHSLVWSPVSAVTPGSFPSERR